jgi:Fe-S cluster assembly ATP-binding protein
VHILVKGRIVASGGPELADQLEIDGYEAFSGGIVDDDQPAAAAGAVGAYDDLFKL